MKAYRSEKSNSSLTTTVDAGSESSTNNNPLYSQQAFDKNQVSSPNNDLDTPSIQPTTDSTTATIVTTTEKKPIDHQDSDDDSETCSWHSY